MTGGRARTGHDRKEKQEELSHIDSLPVATHQRLPAYLVGLCHAFAAHDCVELGYWISSVESNVEVELLSDDQLAQELSRNREVFVMHLNKTQDVSVECLTQVR